MCRQLRDPVLASIPQGAPRRGFVATNEIFGRWIDLKLKAIREIAKDTEHPVTVGHNALHALLPSNSKLDFISHHSYPSSPAGNSSCTYSSLENISALSSVFGVMQAISSDRPRPITLGEFGTRTTSGLWQYYGRRYPASLRHQGHRAIETIGRSIPVKSKHCSLSADCLSGVASTIDWYLRHHTSCEVAWQQVCTRRGYTYTSPYGL